MSGEIYVQVSVKLKTDSDTSDNHEQVRSMNVRRVLQGSKQGSGRTKWIARTLRMSEGEHGASSAS